jgi:hypothetical protein
MRLEPQRGWMLGHIAITKMPPSTIINPADPNKGVTKFALLEAVSEEAKKAGFKAGDLVMAKTMHNIFLKGGTFHRVTFPLEEAICIARDVPLSDFIGSDGKDLVAVTSEQAA